MNHELEESIFAAAIEIESDAKRSQFLEQACGGNAELKKSVEELLANATADSLFENVTRTIDRGPTHPPGIKQLSEFEIICELGRGGMGVVYEAHQKSLNRRVALKVLSAGLGLTSRAVMRFRREAEAAGKLHHTNIVPIYSTGEDKGIHFYAMEMVDGPSLDQIIRHMKAGCDIEASQKLEDDDFAEESQPLPDWVDKTIAFERGDRFSTKPSTLPRSETAKSGSSISHSNKYFDTVATMIADVADALHHAHNHGVISRDIKPSNLLLGSDGRLSVSDFGLARVLEQPGMTITGEMVGTPRYMSPEQISAGRSPLDHRTDIYSLGATLYELLTLRPPFNGQSRDEVIGQILHKEPKSPRSINRRIPKDLETICLKAIERDPDRRYANAQAMAKDLRAFVNRFAISAKRPTAFDRANKWVRKNPVATILAAILFVSIMISTALLYRIHLDRAKNQLVQQEKLLQNIEEQIFFSLLRGDLERAHELLEAGEANHPPTVWVEFSRGQISLFESEYSAAKSSLQRVLDIDENDVSAMSLLAVAHVWGGDEVSYYKQLAEIDLEEVDGFRDRLFTGYALCWGDPGKALELLNEANEIERNHQFLKAIRAQARRLYAMELSDRSDAKTQIDQAFDDLAACADLKDQVPLLVTENVLANMVAENIYRRLAKDQEDSGLQREYSDTADACLKTAELLNKDLQRHESKPETQYVMTLLAGRLGEDAVRELEQRWRQSGLAIDTYPAQVLATTLLEFADYDTASYWLGRFEQLSGPHADAWRCLGVYAKLLNPNRVETCEDLQKQARDYVEQKLDEKKFALLLFDANLLLLLGDESALNLVKQDSHARHIRGAAEAIKYFARPPGKRTMSPARFIKSREKFESPIANRMHANFFLAIEALAAKNKIKAIEHFQECVDDDGFQFTVYRLSKAFIAHEKQWGELLNWEDKE